MRSVGLVLVSLAAAACAPAPRGTGEPAPIPTPPPHVAPWPGPGPQSPPPAPGTDCALSFDVTAAGDGPTRALTVRAVNHGAAAIDVELPDRCPGGVVDLVGLGDRYDYYGTCAAGACPPQPPFRLHLEPGAAQVIASPTVDVRGGPCNAALVPGAYTIVARPPALPVSTCTSGARIVVEMPPRPPAPAPLPPPPPPPPPTKPPATTPPAAPVSSSDPSACTTSADCVVHCASAAGCCGAQCGCRGAINKAFVERVDREFARTCKHERCPAVDCAYEQADSAACENGRCVAHSGPSL